MNGQVLHQLWLLVQMVTIVVYLILKINVESTRHKEYDLFGHKLELSH